MDTFQKGGQAAKQLSQMLIWEKNGKMEKRKWWLFFTPIYMKLELSRVSQIWIRISPIVIFIPCLFWCCREKIKYFNRAINSTDPYNYLVKS